MSYDFLSVSDLYGKSNEDMLVVDQIIDTCVDVFTGFVKIVFNKDEKEKVCHRRLY